MRDRQSILTMLREGICAEAEKPSPNAMDLLPLMAEIRIHGCGKKEIVEILMELKEEFHNTAKEGIVLDLLDIPSGFCHKDFAIWQD